MHIKETAKEAIVEINGFKLRGFLYKKRHSCGTPVVYYEKYDSIFCPKCNKWLEKQCSDSGCEYCGKRPNCPLPKK